MKKILNISLYIIIFLLVVIINVVSIKKFFNNKEKYYILNDLVATNFVIELVSYNEIEADDQNLIDLVNVESFKEKEDASLIETESSITEGNEESNTEKLESIEEVKEIPKENIESVAPSVEEVPVVEEIEEPDINSIILYDGLTEDELILRLERSLKNELSGTAVNFVGFYKNTGLDPYLSVAIVLHETGCAWECSNLVKQCYNYGGMKGGENTYNNTRYTCYSSKEEGINAYLNMLYNNYYSKGLTTAELINPKYASSLEWSVKVNNYIEKIKNN